MKISPRKLGFLESLCIHMHNKCNGGSSIAAITRVKGFINFDVIKQSLNLLFERHPMLRATVYIEEEHYFFNFNAKFEDISIQHIQSGDESTANKIFSDEACMPFDISKGLWRFFLVSYSTPGKIPEYDIIIGCSHAISDGLSIINLSSELLSSMQDIQLDRKPQLPFLSCLPSLETLIRDKLINVNEKIQESEEQDEAVSINSNCFNHEYSDSLEIIPRSFTHTIPASKLDKIIPACRDNRTTVNALVNIAFAKALLQLRNIDEDTVDIFNASNARSLTESPWKVENENMGNYVIAAPTIISLREGEDLWEKCRQFNVDLCNNLNKVPVPDEPKIEDLDAILSSINHLLSMQTTLVKYGVSNVGRADKLFEKIGPNLQVQSSRMRINNTMPHIGVYLLVTTLNNSMDIVFDYAEPLIETAWIKKLAHAIEVVMLELSVK
ncbi:MAG: hypothetical protein OQL19_03315 [Gammaproteobacteria bacterium]|nr:hypothetical protein [Gammaproteobacteria bacterium]